MMPRIDFGHFYKFVASVGLVLVAASIALPWLFSQTTAVLNIPAGSIAKLTDVSQVVILQRQQALSWAQVAVPWVAVGLFICGVASLVWGLAGWKKRQAVLDTGEDLDLSKKKAAFEAMSPQDVEKKLEAETTAPELTTPATPPIGEEGPTPAPAGMGSGRLVQPPVYDRPDRQARMELLRSYEETTALLLRRSFGDAFSVNSNVRLTTGSGAGAGIDVLLDPMDGTPWGQLAVDVRVLPSTVFRMRLPEVMMQMAIVTRDLKGGAVFTGTRGRPRAAAVTCVIILIEEDDPRRGRQDDSWRLQISRANSVLRRPVGAVVVNAAKLAYLRPDELRDAVASAWSDGEGNVSILR